MFRSRNSLDNETRPISITIADQMLGIRSRAQLMLALSVKIKFDPTDKDLTEAPTITDGGIKFIDTEKLKVLVSEAIETEDLSQVPNVLNLHQAIKNVIDSKRFGPLEPRPYNIRLVEDPNRVREALRTTDPIEGLPLRDMEPDNLRPHRGKSGEQTVVMHAPDAGVADEE